MSAEQRIEYADRYHLSDINNKLLKGWRVVSVHPIATHTEHTMEYGAYIVIERPYSNIPEYPDFSHT